LSARTSTLSSLTSPRAAIACGGTGGHLFPGVAVAEQLIARGCRVALLISPKEVDQKAVRTAVGTEVCTLPAVGLVRGGKLAFVRGVGRSFAAARKYFREFRPQAVLGMGGFTSAAPLLAAKTLKAKAFLHESNVIPGRANRWLSWVVDSAYVAFPRAATCLNHRRVTLSGTPVRSQFQGFSVPTARRATIEAACRAAFGFDTTRPLVLVMGGSQGAAGINKMVLDMLPLLAKKAPDWQWLHLTGPEEADRTRHAYQAANLRAIVQPFLTEMDLALGAATVAIARAGGSSLAELAAVRLPSILIPYPAATDNHQYLNAKAFEDSGAARLLEQANATPRILSNLLLDLVQSQAMCQQMRDALEIWHKPRAAAQIAESLLAECGVQNAERAPDTHTRSALKTEPSTQFAA